MAARLQALRPTPSPSPPGGSPQPRLGLLRLPGAFAPCCPAHATGRGRPVRHRVGQRPPRHRDRPQGRPPDRAQALRDAGAPGRAAGGPRAHRGRRRPAPTVACVVASDAPGAAVRAMPPLPFIRRCPRPAVPDATPRRSSARRWLHGRAQAVTDGRRRPRLGSGGRLAGRRGPGGQLADAITEGLTGTSPPWPRWPPSTPRTRPRTACWAHLASLEALDALDPLWSEAPAALGRLDRGRPVLRIADGPRVARLAKARAALPPPRRPRTRPGT